MLKVMLKVYFGDKLLRDSVTIHWLNHIGHTAELPSDTFDEYSIEANNTMYYSYTKEFKEECKKIQMWYKLNEY